MGSKNGPASDCAVHKRLAVALILLPFIHEEDVHKQNICAAETRRPICGGSERGRDLQKPNLLHRSVNTAEACCRFTSRDLISSTAWMEAEDSVGDSGFVSCRIIDLLKSRKWHISTQRRVYFIAVSKKKKVPSQNLKFHEIMFYFLLSPEVKLAIKDRARYHCLWRRN